jgi:arylsulfatase A-like enzyme
LDELRRLGQLDNTIILFTSDHGCHFRTRNSEYKRSCHEASIRIPMVWAGPGFESAGTIDRLVSLVDIPPTLLSAAGLDVPISMQGRNLMSLVRNRQAEWDNEVFVQISEDHVGRAIRTDRWKYCAIAPDRNGWKDVGSDRYVDGCLYDLHADPYELDNLASRAEYEPTLRELRDRLKRQMVRAGEAAPEIGP